jgi:hypothetical protein
LKAERERKCNVLFTADRTNGGVGGEVECGNLRDIDAGVKSLEGSLEDKRGQLGSPRI